MIYSDEWDGLYAFPRDCGPVPKGAGFASRRSVKVCEVNGTFEFNNRPKSGI